MFLVLKGRLIIRTRSRHYTLHPGDCIAIPRGVEHKPVAATEAHILLLEPRTT